MSTIEVKNIRENMHSFNLKALELVEEVFVHSDFAVAVGPTGIGKTSIAFGLIDRVFSWARNILIVEPLKTIQHSHKQGMFWKPEWEKKVRYTTYSQLGDYGYLSSEALKANELTEFDLIIFDEVHHIDAPVWAKGFLRLKEVNPGCKFLGLTATPIRYLSGGVNVIDKHFEGNEITIITLPEAIERGVFTRPVYVNAVYDMEKVSNQLETLINKAKVPDFYANGLRRQLGRVKHNWDSHHGIEGLIRANLDEYATDTDNLKFIVFMETIKDLEKNRPIVEGWFESMGVRKNLNSYCLYTGMSDKDEAVLKAFDTPNEDSVDLLFTINKANEGVHLDNVSGVILMRSTFSPTVFYQQIGRCFSSGMLKRPLIFDLVNNSDAIKTQENLLIPSNQPPKVSKIKKHYRGEGVDLTVLDYSTVSVTSSSSDVVSLLSKVIARVEKRLTIYESDAESAWLACYHELRDYIQVNRSLPSQKRDFQLFNWLQDQANKARLGVLDSSRVGLLWDLGLSFTIVR